MKGGNYTIEIRKAEVCRVTPKLPFLCTHNQSGTYCGKGLVIKDTKEDGDIYILVDLGDKENGGFYNTVFSRSNLEELMSLANIVPKEGKVIIYE